MQPLLLIREQSCCHLAKLVRHLIGGTMASSIHTTDHGEHQPTGCIETGQSGISLYWTPSVTTSSCLETLRAGKTVFELKYLAAWSLSLSFEDAAFLNFNQLLHLISMLQTFHIKDVVSGNSFHGCNQFRLTGCFGIWGPRGSLLVKGLILIKIDLNNDLGDNVLKLRGQMLWVEQKSSVKV